MHRHGPFEDDPRTNQVAYKKEGDGVSGMQFHRWVYCLVLHFLLLSTSMFLLHLNRRMLLYAFANSVVCVWSPR